MAAKKIPPPPIHYSRPANTPTGHRIQTKQFNSAAGARFQPPPTRYGPSGAAQAKTANSTAGAKGAYAPPPTAFGPSTPNRRGPPPPARNSIVQRMGGDALQPPPDAPPLDAPFDAPPLDAPPLNAPPQIQSTDINYRADPQIEAGFRRWLNRGRERYDQLRAGSTHNMRENTRIFFRNYSHEQDPQRPGHIITTHHQDGGGGFHNVMKPSEGIMIANANAKGGTGPVLPGSEILFQQYLHIALENNDTGSRGLDTRLQLHSLERHNVISASGTPVIQYIYGTSSRLAEGRERILLPGSDEFNACLGTENLTSAGFLISDHGYDLNIAGIRNIVLSGRNMTVNFHPGPDTRAGRSPWSLQMWPPVVRRVMPPEPCKPPLHHPRDDHDRHPPPGAAALLAF